MYIFSFHTSTSVVQRDFPRRRLGNPTEVRHRAAELQQGTARFRGRVQSFFFGGGPVTTRTMMGVGFMDENGVRSYSHHVSA